MLPSHIVQTPLAGPAELRRRYMRRRARVSELAVDLLAGMALGEDRAEFAAWPVPVWAHASVREAQLG